MDSSNIFDNASLKDGFAGDRRFLKGFLAKIELVFILYPERYQDEESKVIYLISRLYGKAMNWAATLIEQNDPCLHNYGEFKDKLKSFYGSSDFTYTANQMLRSLKQQHIGGVRGYILEFNQYADESTWNEEAKMDAFLAGLHPQIALKILEMFPGPRNLIALQTIASRIDSRLHNNRQFFNNSNSFRSRPRNNRPRNTTQANKKKTLRGPLSKSEKERRIRENLCLYCGASDHQLNNCPKKGRKTTSSASLMAVPGKHYRERQAEITMEQRARRITTPDQPVVDFSMYIECQPEILIDTGSKFNLIDKYYCSDFHIPYYDDDELPKITGIGGSQSIIGVTPPITLRYKDHMCQTCFYVTDLPFYSCLLGSDWLKLHNPDIDFSTNELFFDSEYCNSNCHSFNPTYSDPSTNSTFLNFDSSSFGSSVDAVPILALPVFQVPENSDKSSSASTSDDSNSPSTSSKASDTSDTDPESCLPDELAHFKDVFSESSADKLPPHRPYDCQINLIKDSKLFYGPIYPLTDEESSALKEYIQENLKKGFIRKSKSPAGAPVLFVPKKNGKLRMCVDYRRLNAITIRDSYPLPLIQDMLEHLGKGKIFSKLDLRSAYNLVRIKSGDEYKTAFTCKYGHFEYLVMPFGLKNAPAVFQHFINDVLEDILGKFVYSYIDDIIIFSPNYKIHIKHVNEVLSRLRKAGLFAKLEKCEFFASFIDFLGHRISSEGISMDPNKVDSILNWPTPSCVKDVQSFIGLANYYRRFIPGFAKIAHPLHKLLRKNINFTWTTDAQSAFDCLKSKFTSAPILIHPNRDLPFTVETDSSNFAIGAILSQVSPNDNLIHPVAFFSRSLNGAEKNYPIYDKELLAIISALENWRHFLKGSSSPFTIYSDHRNLLFQKKPEKMTQRLVRWSLFLSEFNFKILYRSGTSNGKPDALSL